MFFYVVNKRLDEWVSEDRLDLSAVHYPKKFTRTRALSPPPVENVANSTRRMTRKKAKKAQKAKKARKAKKAFEDLDNAEMASTPIPVVINVSIVYFSTLPMHCECKIRAD